MPRRELKEGGIYSLALSPFQYTARRVDRGNVEWLLIPQWQDIPILCGPLAYVTTDGRIGVHDGITERTTDDLDFTGRYHDAGQPKQEPNII